MRILVTGFEPFGNETVNPSYEAVKRMKIHSDNIELVIKEIPVVFGRAIDVLDDTIEKESPDAVICIGQAGGRSDMTVERVGINMDDARIPDNDGNQPIDEKVFEDGENAYFSNLPIKAIVNTLRENNIPASVSNTAGTYVCNNLLYGTMYLIDKKYPDMKGGFVHVPFLPEQVIDKPNMPSMTLDMITRALEILVETAAVTEVDMKLTGGKTH